MVELTHVVNTVKMEMNAGIAPTVIESEKAATVNAVVITPQSRESVALTSWILKENVCLAPEKPWTEMESAAHSSMQMEVQN